MSETLNLKAIIQVTEHVKSVVAVAHRINLLALNAMLLAKRSGVAAVGFGVISNELRSFSRELTSGMRSLQEVSFSSLDGLSKNLKRHRLHHLVALADQALGRTDALSNVLLRQEQHLQEAERVLQSNHLILALQLADAQRLCAYGDVISRFAKIEAAYGGSFSNQLTEIAQEFTDLIRGVQPLVDELAANVRG